MKRIQVATRASEPSTSPRAYFGGLDTPAYLAMNPYGRVPTIDEDGIIVWKSTAIVRYLAARYSDGVLWDRDPERITHAGYCQTDKLQGSRYCNNFVRDLNVHDN